MNHSDFIPAHGLRNGHLQTLAAAYLYRHPWPEQAARHEMPLPDGDRLVVHDDRPAAWRPTEPVALLLHGVAGSHRSPYMLRLAHKLNQRSVRTFRLDFRGCGAGEFLAARPGHAGRSEDVATAVDFLDRLCPSSPVLLVGYSMGGNVALKYLGEAGAAAGVRIARAIAIAPPIDLPACSRNLEQGWNRLYSRGFVNRLWRQLKKRRTQVASYAAIDLRRPPRRLVDFDHRVTAALSGFTGVGDYYRRASAGPLLTRLTVPTLIVAADDDPLIPIAIFRERPYASATQLVRTAFGGHLGYLGRSGIDADRWWLDWRMLEWLTAALPATTFSPLRPIGSPANSPCHRESLSM